MQLLNKNLEYQATTGATAVMSGNLMGETDRILYVVPPLGCVLQDWAMVKQAEDLSLCLLYMIIIIQSIQFSQEFPSSPAWWLDTTATVRPIACC